MQTLREHVNSFFDKDLDIDFLVVRKNNNYSYTHSTEKYWLYKLGEDFNNFIDLLPEVNYEDTEYVIPEYIFYVRYTNGDRVEFYKKEEYCYYIHIKPNEYDSIQDFIDLEF